MGTSSTRRRAQLLRSSLDVEVRELRGNVDTRLRKLREGEYDAIVLAEAGMQRLDMDLPGTQLLPQWFVPSPNQARSRWYAVMTLSLLNRFLLSITRRPGWIPRWNGP